MMNQKIVEILHWDYLVVSGDMDIFVRETIIPFSTDRPFDAGSADTCPSLKLVRARRTLGCSVCSISYTSYEAPDGRIDPTTSVSFEPM